MTEKVLGKITRAEFGTDKDRPFLIGLQLSFSFHGCVVTDGGKYTLNIDKACRTRNQSEHSQAVTKRVEDIYELLNKAKVNYVSQLVGKPVEVTLEDEYFKDFRILTEVL